MMRLDLLLCLGFGLRSDVPAMARPPGRTGADGGHLAGGGVRNHAGAWCIGPNGKFGDSMLNSNRRAWKSRNLRSWN